MNFVGGTTSKEEQSYHDLLGSSGKERRAKAMASKLLNLPGASSRRAKTSSTSSFPSLQRRNSSGYKSTDPEFYINQIPLAEEEVGTLRHRGQFGRSCSKRRLVNFLNQTRDIRFQNISKKVQIIVAALTLIILIRLTGDWNIRDYIPPIFRHTKQSFKSSIQEERLSKFKATLLPLVYSDLDGDVFRNSSSPQYKALEWLAKTDEYFKDDIPSPPSKKSTKKLKVAGGDKNEDEDDVGEGGTDSDNHDTEVTSNSDKKDDENDDDDEETYYQLIQRYVLALLYFSTNGGASADAQNNSLITGETDESSSSSQQPWAKHKSYKWLTPDTHVCDWNNEGGVRKCSSTTKHIFDLSLSNNLDGTIPSEISKLTSLRVLYLSHNNLKGTIPTSIGEMSKLNYLGLQYNKLTGTVPTELGNLHHLSYLGLEKNDVAGSVSSTHPICKLLRVLDSDNNPTKLTTLMVFTTDCRGIESTGKGTESSALSRPPEISCDCCTECYRY